MGKIRKKMEKRRKGDVRFGARKGEEKAKSEEVRRWRWISSTNEVQKDLWCQQI